MKTSQNLDRSRKKGRSVLPGAAQVYVEPPFHVITENEHSQNGTSTSGQDDAHLSRKERQKAWKNRAQVWSPDELLEFLKAHFRYSATRGKLFYRQGPSRGNAVRTTKADGYRRTSYKSLEFRQHRVIWMLANNAPIPPGYEIDHINGKRSDNRPANLRLVSRLQNQWNAGMRKDNTSGLKGVTQTRSGTFAANISINGKVKYLGAFPTALEASEAYEAKAREIRGEYVPGAAA